LAGKSQKIERYFGRTRKKNGQEKRASSATPNEKQKKSEYERREMKESGGRGIIQISRWKINQKFIQRGEPGEGLKTLREILRRRR